MKWEYLHVLLGQIKQKKNKQMQRTQPRRQKNSNCLEYSVQGPFTTDPVLFWHSQQELGVLIRLTQQCAIFLKGIF